jgi:hypothetical protein
LQNIGIEPAALLQCLCNACFDKELVMESTSTKSFGTVFGRARCLTWRNNFLYQPLLVDVFTQSNILSILSGVCDNYIQQGVLILENNIKENINQLIDRGEKVNQWNRSS